MPQPPTTAAIDLREIRELGVRNLDQYFGLWAVEDTRFLAMLERIGGMDLAAHVKANLTVEAVSGSAAGGVRLLVRDHVAIIDIEGTLTKHGSSLSEANSTIALRRKVRAAAADDEIRGLILRIDSPGGTVAGTADLGRDVAEAAERKPVYAYVEDLTASAAYWIASQASKVYANDATAFVGSIGTFVGLYDLSGLAGQLGIKPVVIKSGRFKATGFEGTEITGEQKALLQELVDKTQAEFNAAVARGRKLAVARVAELADGRIHIAPDAQRLSLIDGIQTLDATLAEVSREAQGRSRTSARRSSADKETTSMPQETNDTPKAASIAELKAAFPDDPTFTLDAAEKGLSLLQAKAAYCERLQEEVERRDEQLAAKDKEIGELKAKAAKPKIGAEPVPETATATVTHEDPIAEFQSRVAAKVKAGMSRQEANRSVIAEDGDLHEAYITAYNRNHGRRIAS